MQSINNLTFGELIAVAVIHAAIIDCILITLGY